MNKEMHKQKKKKSQNTNQKFILVFEIKELKTEGMPSNQLVLSNK